MLITTASVLCPGAGTSGNDVVQTWGQTIGSGGTGTRGTVITGGAIHTKGSWTQLSSGLPYDVDALSLDVFIHSSTGTDYLIDIGIGAAGQEQVIVPNISSSIGTASISQRIDLPIHVPAGHRISCRLQSSGGAGRSLEVILRTIKGDLAHLMSMSSCFDIGTNLATSGMVNCDSGGTADTKGVYSELTAATSQSIKYLIIQIGNRQNAVIGANSRILLDLATGSPETIIIPDVFASAETGADTYLARWFNFPYAIAQGTRLAARYQNTNTDAADRLIDVGILAFR